MIFIGDLDTKFSLDSNRTSVRLEPNMVYIYAPENIFKDGLIEYKEDSKTCSLTVLVKDVSSSLFRIKFRLYEILENIFRPVGHRELLCGDDTKFYIDIDSNYDSSHMFLTDPKTRARDLKPGMISCLYHTPSDLIGYRYEVMEVVPVNRIGSELYLNVEHNSLLIANDILISD